MADNHESDEMFDRWISDRGDTSHPNTMQAAFRAGWEAAQLRAWSKDDQRRAPEATGTGSEDEERC